MRKKKIILLVVISLIALLALGSAGYFIYNAGVEEKLESDVLDEENNVEILIDEESINLEESDPTNEELDEEEVSQEETSSTDSTKESSTNNNSTSSNTTNSNSTTSNSNSNSNTNSNSSSNNSSSNSDSSNSSSTNSNNNTTTNSSTTDTSTSSYIGVPDPNSYYYSMHHGVIEYATMDACLAAADEIGFKDTVDILNLICIDVVDSEGTVLGEYLYINCSSGNCNKYK